MEEITQFIAVPYDRADQHLVPGRQVKCANPSSAIEQAKHLWKTFGHAGAAAIVRTGHPEAKTTILGRMASCPRASSKTSAHLRADTDELVVRCRRGGKAIAAGRGNVGLLACA